MEIETAFILNYENRNSNYDTMKIDTGTIRSYEIETAIILYCEIRDCTYA